MDASEDMVYKVYKHTLPISVSGKDNDMVYIGITSMNPPEKRWKNGLGYYQNEHFFSAIQKYGWNNFKHEILFDKLIKEEAEEKEIELISVYNATNRENGYNKDNGGTSAGRLTEEQRSRLSEIGKERLKVPENNPMYGKHHSEETRKKIAQKATGRKFSEKTKRKIAEASSKREWSDESKKKLSESLMGHEVSDETKRKISESAKERFKNKENHPLYGKHRSEETKRKLSEYNKELFKDPAKHPSYGNTKKIIDLDTDIIYDSAYEVSDIYGISVESIRANCRGDTKTCGKEHHRFKYLKDWESQCKDSIEDKQFEYPLYNSIPVRCIELDAVYSSAKVAGKELGIDNSTISKCCKGAKYCKTAGKLPDGTKLHWEYYKEVT